MGGPLCSSGERGSRRAVASLVGYLLVFALVLSGAVVLSTMGLGVVLETGETGDRHLPALEALDRGVLGVTEDGSYRDTVLEPQDASLGYGSTYSITVSAEGGGVSRTIQVTGRTVRYEPGSDRVLAYEAGLVADNQTGGTRPVIRADPHIDTAGERVVIVLPTTRKAPRSASLVSTDAGGSVPVVLERTEADSARLTGSTTEGNATAMNATITVQGGDVIEGWGAYFEGRNAFEPTDIDGDGETEYVADADGDGALDTAGASFRTPQLFVRTATVTVGLGESL